MLKRAFDVVASGTALLVLSPRLLPVAARRPATYWEESAELRPGLSGAGSIVFRNEEYLLSTAPNREKVYAELVVPYKMALENWYRSNQSFALDLKLIALTVLAMLYHDLDVRSFLRCLPAPAEAFRRLNIGREGRLMT